MMGPPVVLVVDVARRAFDEVEGVDDAALVRVVGRGAVHHAAVDDDHRACAPPPMNGARPSRSVNTRPAGDGTLVDCRARLTVPALTGAGTNAFSSYSRAGAVNSTPISFCLRWKRRPLCRPSDAPRRSQGSSAGVRVGAGGAYFIQGGRRRTLVRARDELEAAVRRRAVLQREPQADRRQRLRVEERRVLVRHHCAQPSTSVGRQSDIWSAPRGAHGQCATPTIAFAANVGLLQRVRMQGEERPDRWLDRRARHARTPSPTAAAP